MVVRRGAYGLVGAKSDERYINIYYSCVKRCSSNCTEFIDACVGAGNITSRMMGGFQRYVVNDADTINAILFYGLSKYNKEVIYKAMRLDKNEVSISTYEEWKHNLRINFDSIASMNKDDIVDLSASALLVKNLSYNGVNTYSVAKHRVPILSRINSLHMFSGINEVYSMDLLDFLEELYLDGELVNSKRFIFIDPAYLNANVLYNNTSVYTTQEYHKKLCRSVRRFKNVLICGYESKLYKDELEKYGFYKTHIGTKAVTAGRKANIRKEEFVWTSYKI